jgi:hypothetical protein
VHRDESSGASGDNALRKLVDAIVTNRLAAFSEMLSAFPALAIARFENGANRQGSSNLNRNFIVDIGYYINAGDTALHFAAASYRADMPSKLLNAGAHVRARNRRGTEPLHLAVVGGPNSPRWNPPAQCATIACLMTMARTRTGPRPCIARSGRGVLMPFEPCSNTEQIPPSARRTGQRQRNWRYIRQDAPARARLRPRLSNGRSCVCWKASESTPHGYPRSNT